MAAEDISIEDITPENMMAALKQLAAIFGSNDPVPQSARDLCWPICWSPDAWKRKPNVKRWAWSVCSKTAERLATERAAFEIIDLAQRIDHFCPHREISLAREQLGEIKVRSNISTASLNHSPTVRKQTDAILRGKLLVWRAERLQSRIVILDAIVAGIADIRDHRLTAVSKFHALRLVSDDKGSPPSPGRPIMTGTCQTRASAYGLWMVNRSCRRVAIVFPFVQFVVTWIRGMPGCSLKPAAIDSTDFQDAFSSAAQRSAVIALE
jgi:hypothetical protein